MDYFSQQPPYPHFRNDENRRRAGTEGRAFSRDPERSVIYEEPDKLSINTQSNIFFREVALEPVRIHHRQSPSRSNVKDKPRPLVIHETSYVRTSMADDIKSQLSQALVPSPKVDQTPDSFFHNSFNAEDDDGFSVSDITEREAAAEAATYSRKVKFQGPDEVIDASDVAFRNKVDEWVERGGGRRVG